MGCWSYSGSVQQVISLITCHLRLKATMIAALLFWHVLIVSAPERKKKFLVEMSHKFVDSAFPLLHFHKNCTHIAPSISVHEEAVMQPWQRKPIHASLWTLLYLSPYSNIIKHIHPININQLCLWAILTGGGPCRFIYCWMNLGTNERAICFQGFGQGSSNSMRGNIFQLP